MGDCHTRHVGWPVHNCLHAGRVQRILPLTFLDKFGENSDLLQRLRLYMSSTILSVAIGVIWATNVRCKTIFPQEGWRRAHTKTASLSQRTLVNQHIFVMIVRRQRPPRCWDACCSRLVRLWWYFCTLALVVLAQPVQAQDATPTVRIPAPPDSDTNSTLSPSVSLNTTNVSLSPAPSTVPPSTDGPTTTWSPTGSWSPTITPLPTKTASPTSELCNICGGVGGDDATIAQGSDLLVLPNNVNFTCTEAGVAGQTGLLTPANCAFLQDLIASTWNTTNVCGCTGGTGTSDGSYEPCNICPPGQDISISNGKIPTPMLLLNTTSTAANGNSSNAIITTSRQEISDFLQCGFAQASGATGLWDADVCAELQLATDVNGTNPCGCAPTNEPPTANVNSTSCPICGNSTQQVTNATSKLVVQLPAEVLETLPYNESFFTCGSLEQSGTIGALWSPEVCAFLQMSAEDVCVCEARPTMSPSAVASGGSAALPTSNPPRSASGGRTTTWSRSILLALLVTLFTLRSP
jgi:hypothetical protein